MKVIIIGGGIAGLSFAACLERIGIDYIICEKAEEFRPVGSGITIAPNAILALRKFGLDAALLKSGQRIDDGIISDHRFNSLARTGFGELERKFGAPLIGIHRAELQDVLFSFINRSKLLPGRRLIKIDQGEGGVTAHFEGADPVKGDIVVAADGIRSVAREFVSPDAEIRYSGYTSWRGITDDPWNKSFRGRSLEAWGFGCRFGMVSIGNDKIYWFAVANSPQGGRDDMNLVRERLANRFAEFHPNVFELINKTDPQNIVRTDISDLPNVKTWSNGRIVLIGDAAHATTPNLGQGGNQAIEDSVCLALQLKTNPRDFPRAFAEYEKLRRLKAARVIRESWNLGKIAHIENKLVGKIRNLAFKLTPPQMIESRTGWLFELNF